MNQPATQWHRHQAQRQHLRDLYRDSTSRLSETKSRWAWASRSWSIATMWRCWLQWHTRPCSRLEDFSLRQMTTMMVRMKRASRTGVHIEDWLTKTWRCWRQFLWTNSCWQVTNAEISVGSCPGAWHTTTEPRIRKKWPIPNGAARVPTPISRLGPAAHREKWARQSGPRFNVRLWYTVICVIRHVTRSYLYTRIQPGWTIKQVWSHSIKVKSATSGSF